MTVYMDNNATTALKKDVLDAMLPFYTQIYGNASAKFYQAGKIADAALQASRKTVADAIGAEENEIYFTASGSEADNWAIKGAVYANRNKGNHIITSKIEHHAVLHTCAFLEKNDYRVTYLTPDETGRINPADVEAAITPQTVLITIMAANNEIGTIQPIREIGHIAGKYKIILHTDAVQAIGHMPVDVRDWGVDLLSVSAHKFHGPKGVGALYIRNGVEIENLIHGGGQERGRRAATENLAGIAGLAKAISLATENLTQNMDIMQRMRDKLIAGIQQTIPYCRLNGPHDETRLCNNVNFSFSFVEGESVLMLLDMAGIAASTGSACTEGAQEPSHVLMATGLSRELAHGSVRLSVSQDTTDEEVAYVIGKLAPIVERLRSLSPLYEEELKHSKKTLQR